jgi:hypothetical protein
MMKNLADSMMSPMSSEAPKLNFYALGVELIPKLKIASLNLVF